MRLIKASVTIEDIFDGKEILRKIEKAGRVCYKSENKITVDSAKKFVKFIIEHGHETILEHEKITVRVICDRGVSHEIVRHRLASYCQESTRYCNYSKDKFNQQLTFILPSFWKDEKDLGLYEPLRNEKWTIWFNVMVQAEKNYLELISLGASPQEARSILPNSLKTEIVMTMNLREWRHFFKLRASLKAHPQMREIARPLLDEFKKRIPIVFDDIDIGYKGISI